MLPDLARVHGLGFNVVALTVALRTPIKSGICSKWAIADRELFRESSAAKSSVYAVSLGQFVRFTFKQCFDKIRVASSRSMRQWPTGDTRHSDNLQAASAEIFSELRDALADPEDDGNAPPVPLVPEHAVACAVLSGHACSGTQAHTRRAAQTALFMHFAA